jgi:hypothetical protein
MSVGCISAVLIRASANALLAVLIDRAFVSTVIAFYISLARISVSSCFWILIVAGIMVVKSRAAAVFRCRLALCGESALHAIKW